MRKIEHDPASATDAPSQPFAVATEYHRAEWQDKMQRRFRRVMLCLILLSFLLALIGHFAIGTLGFQIHRYTQGDLTVCAYGRLEAVGDTATTPKGSLYYGNGLSFERIASDCWEGSDGSTFTGEMQNGFFCFGTHESAHFTYTGSFFANRPQGKGTLCYPDGTRYEGDFANGTFQGSGVLTYPDGAYFVGTFVGGKRHGVGTHYEKDGTPIRTVPYENDIPLDW